METPIMFNDSLVLHSYCANLALKIEYLKSEVKILKEDLEEAKTENNYLMERNVDLLIMLLKISPHNNI